MGQVRDKVQYQVKCHVTGKKTGQCSGPMQRANAEQIVYMFKDNCKGKKQKFGTDCFQSLTMCTRSCTGMARVRPVHVTGKRTGQCSELMQNNLFICSRIISKDKNKNLEPIVLITYHVYTELHGHGPGEASS